MSAAAVVVCKLLVFRTQGSLEPIRKFKLILRTVVKRRTLNSKPMDRSQSQSKQWALRSSKKLLRICKGMTPFLKLKMGRDCLKTMKWMTISMAPRVRTRMKTIRTRKVKNRRLKKQI